jgi:hypothetical protein
MGDRLIAHYSITRGYLSQVGFEPEMPAVGISTPSICSALVVYEDE